MFLCDLSVGEDRMTQELERPLERNEVGSVKEIFWMLYWSIAGLLYKVAKTVFGAMDRWCCQERRELRKETNKWREEAIDIKESFTFVGFSKLRSVGCMW